jgi:capsid assembly protease
MKYPRITTVFYSTPWAILPEKLVEIEAFVRGKASGAFDDCDGVDFAAGPSGSGYQQYGKVAVVPINGTILPRVGPLERMSGATSSVELGATMDRLAGDKSVKAVVLAIDSPGGSVFLLPEAAAKVASLAGQKKVVAVADAIAASAAYWLATQASEIFVTPSGQIGSIGVIAAHLDQSKADELRGERTTLVTSSRYKGELDSSLPLSAEARDALQSSVNQYHQMFVRAVAKGRGVSEARVEADFGQGRMKLAKDAVAAGMADGIATVEQVLRRLGAEGGTSGAGAFDGGRLQREALARCAELGL